MLKKVLFLLLLSILLFVAYLSFHFLRFNQPKYEAPFDPEQVDVNYQALAKAIEHKTISHKAEMIDTAAFLAFQKQLALSFPLVDSLLELTPINTFSLVYKWKGKSAKTPIVLAAHIDVVPVEYKTKDSWKAEPFSGAIKDSAIYGRGTLDDKGSLISMLNAVENLLKMGFKPSHDIYFCFGHDEEIRGSAGAAKIVEHLAKNKVSPKFVLDEGGIVADGLVPGIASKVALIGISEKGYVSLDVSVQLDGGHSSMPTKKTAINTLVNAIQILEQHPLESRISEPLDGFIEYVGPNLPLAQKLAFSNKTLFKGLIFNAYEKNASSAALVQTTQATTVINAGIKDNVIPSRATATVNYRLLPGDTPKKMLNRARALLKDTNVHVNFHSTDTVPASPVSPYKCAEFRYLQRCINTIYPEALVSPYLVLAQTDGRHYYALTDKVYRFLPFCFKTADLKRLHGVNERLTLTDYEQAVHFYTVLIKNLGVLS